MNSLTSHFIFLLAKLDKFPFSDAINLASGKYYSTRERYVISESDREMKKIEKGGRYN